VQDPALQSEADALFPRRLSNATGSVIVHAPQVDEWLDYRAVKARVALEVVLTDGSPTLFGTAHVAAATHTDLDTRTVTLYDVVAERFVFTGVASLLHERAAALARTLVSKQPQKMPLDVFLGYLQGAATKAQGAALRMEPPPIFVAYGPAILVITNGKPVLAPIADSPLAFAVNTNWDLFRIGETWYLRNQDQWLSAADPAGAWSTVSKLPEAFSHLPDDENWTEVRAWVPPSSAAPAPQVFYSDQPAELIRIDGKPKLEPIGAAGLSYIRNTASDVFVSEQHYYYLASGRWFTAPALEGKWRAAAPLPAAFASIPKLHAKAHVRVSVPGTEEAKRAVEEVAIPRTAVLDRTAAPSVAVTYNGAPQFVAVAGTTLTRAANSMYDVIGDGSHYYLCYDAVWYVATTPTGPWRTADAVPPAIYTIPPSSPVHHATHVKVYESSPTTVTTGYTGGYYGAYSTGTTVVYGTGYTYPPYVAYVAALYPVYFWYPYSYGYGSWYNPNNGAFGEAVVAYGPYGGAGRSAAYNPSTGTYRRGYAAWDDDEIAGTVRAYNPRTGTGALTNRYATEDEAWGETAIVRGDEWVYSQRERHGDTAHTEIDTSRGGSGEITAQRDGDTITRSAEFSKDDRSITSSGQLTQDGYSGSFQTSGGASGAINRSYENGELSRDAQVSRNGQTVDLSGTTIRTQQGLQTEFETSGGASGTVSREMQDGTVHRSGEVTRGGQTIESETVRGSDGAVGRVESDNGESAGFARAENGDLYAAKDGEVYRKTDSGWEHHEGGDWRRSASSSSAAATTSAEGSRVDELDRDREARTRGFERYGQLREQRRTELGSRDRGARTTRRR
jgi:hypothetical protein